MYRFLDNVERELERQGFCPNATRLRLHTIVERTRDGWVPRSKPHLLNRDGLNDETP